MNQIDFYFDCSSPWTWLGFESMQALLARRPDIDVTYKPILVGGVFNAVNPSVYENRENPVPPKARYYGKDLQDWARHVGLTIGMPDVFPVNSVKAMRGAIFALEEARLVPFAREAFKAYWTELKDISQDDVLAGVAERAGLDVDTFFEKIADQRYKDALRSNTDELVERGGFGSPTFFLNGDDMYFGNDRMVLVEANLVDSSS